MSEFEKIIRASYPNNEYWALMLWTDAMDAAYAQKQRRERASPRWSRAED